MSKFLYYRWERGRKGTSNGITYEKREILKLIVSTMLIQIHGRKTSNYLLNFYMTTICTDATKLLSVYFSSTQVDRSSIATHSPKTAEAKLIIALGDYAAEKS